MAEGVTEEELSDYNKNSPYKERVIVFYDILGWRGITEKTGGDPERIGRLRREILLHSRILHKMKAENSQVSTFSDNVAISAPVDQNLPNLLQAVTVMQLGTQSRGLLIRGGVTIGQLVHDSECVFGPALNRAYDLERRVAKYPRIILDPELFRAGDMSEFCSVEDGVNFLDPFRREFLDRVTRLWGVYRDGKKVRTEDVWRLDYETFVHVLMGPLGDREHEKIAWVVDRIAKHSGLPPANTHPRNLQLRDRSPLDLAGS